MNAPQQWPTVKLSCIAKLATWPSSVCSVLTPLRTALRRTHHLTDLTSQTIGDVERAPRAVLLDRAEHLEPQEYLNNVLNAVMLLSAGQHPAVARDLQAVGNLTCFGNTQATLALLRFTAMLRFSEQVNKRCAQTAWPLHY